MSEILKRRFAALSKFAGGVEFGLWVLFVLSMIGAAVIAAQTDYSGDDHPYVGVALASAVASAITIIPLIVLMRAVNLWSLRESGGYKPPVNALPNKPRNPASNPASNPAPSGMSGLTRRISTTSIRDDGNPDDPKIQV
jgi:hypothetical protein